MSAWANLEITDNSIMATLKFNLASNYIGHLWVALMGVVFIPAYINVLGIEVFGLIGILLSLQALTQLFDFGLGGAVNREISRLSQKENAGLIISALVRTAEAIVWSMVVVLAVLFIYVSGPLSLYWLSPESISADEARVSLLLIGLVLAFIWPVNFYQNCLSGMEQQASFNVVNVIFSTLRGAGVLPVLYFISPTINAFLLWYMGVAILHSLMLGLLVRKKLSVPISTANFDLKPLRELLRFAIGMFLISALGVVISQLDRVLLAYLRPLEDLGYFTVAASLAFGVGRVIQPLFNVIYPRFTRLVASNRQSELLDLYRISSQSIALITSVVAAVIVFFSRQILFLWTGDVEIVDKVSIPLSLLVAGTLINGYLNTPYALQLAHGWTGLGIRLNALAVLYCLPFGFFAIGKYGVMGAACIWPLLNLINYLIALPITHRRYLKEYKNSQYLSDTWLPCIVASLTAFFLSLVFSKLEEGVSGILRLVFVLSLTFILTFLSSSLLHVYAGRAWSSMKVYLQGVERF